MIVISDTSPITNLIKIGELNLLKALFGRILIPHSVEEELKRLPDQKQLLEETEWIEVASINDLTLFQELIKEVHTGEAEAMTLAIELQADYLLIDEQIGRAVAERLGIKITGLLGILILAKKRELIPVIKPYLQRLVYEAEFYISPSLFQRVLKSVNE